MSTQTQAIKAGTVAAPLVRKRESLWADAWRRLLRNRAAVAGLVIIVGMILAAILADFLAVKPYAEQVLVDQNKVPPWILAIFPNMKPYAKLSMVYPMGADYVGRDIYSRLLYGARISLTIAFIGPMISLFIGVALGSLSGYSGGWLDNILMRVVDVLYAFPSLLFIILLMTFFRGAASRWPVGSFGWQLGVLDAK